MSDIEQPDPKALAALLKRHYNAPPPAVPPPFESYRVQQAGNRPAWIHHALRAAAAIALFAGGWILGRRSGDTPAPAIVVAQPGPEPAVIEVQRTGSAFVAALSRLAAEAGDQPLDPHAEQVAIQSLHAATRHILTISTAQQQAAEVFLATGSLNLASQVTAPSAPSPVRF
jgi:hypothetical protein